MREIIFDTETTGFKPEEGERIIEIGAIEFVNRVATGKTFHHYINPVDRKVDPGAFRVHGLSDEFLSDKKTFAQICDEFIEFIDGAHLVAHNAQFDINFLNHELARLGHPPLQRELVIDTLEIARRKHPMAQNSLDRLCERYQIDNSRREFHGALLDAELLSEVYIELLGGRQTSLELIVTKEANKDDTSQLLNMVRPERPKPLASLLTDEEKLAHQEFIKTLGDEPIWQKKNATKH